ncbi:MAG TPA: type VI immunity family protein [Variovorax sp.]|nr:type VI immunity family protein [Variovorax sp.]
MEDIAPLEITDSATGAVLVRNGVTLALFLDRRVHECSDALIQAFDLFLASVPADALTWAVVSATSEEWRPVDASVIARIRESMEPAGARKRKLTAFRINDFAGAAPQYGFTLADRYKDKPDSMTLVQMSFPMHAVDAGHADGTCDFVGRVAALLSPVAGYCAPSLLQADAHQSEAFERIRGLALRYPGYDVAMNDLTRLRLGPRVRGARWITLLGAALLESAGGFELFRKALPVEMEMSQAGATTLIRAGRTPELGDTNRQLETPLLRAVARVLEPITLFREAKMLLYLANFDEDLLDRWERRFLD